MRRRILPQLFAWTVVVGLLHATTAWGGETHWPRWRGPHENGHYHGSGVPVKWTADDVVWKVTIPGRGQSSPIVWGEKIFLTTALDNGKQRVVLGIDRNTGKTIWERVAWTGEPEPIHKMNSWASATCVTDGEVLVAFFGRAGIHAFDLSGKPLWSRDLGPFQSPWGVSACPVIYGDLVIQNCDADTDAHIIALDKRTGNPKWKTQRPDHRGWSTPIMATAGNRRELVLNGHEGVIGYDPDSGRQLWNCKGFNGRGEPTVTPAGNVLCVVNGLSGDFYAVKPGGQGDVTATHMAWHTPRKGGRDTPSPIVIGNYVIVVDMKGVATCYDAVGGSEIWKERIGLNFSASPIAAGGLAYFQDEQGETTVIQPGPKLEVVAKNSVGGGSDELFRPSPAVSDAQLFIRSDRVLYCVGKRIKEPTSAK